MFLLFAILLCSMGCAPSGDTDILTTESNRETEDSIPSEITKADETPTQESDPSEIIGCAIEYIFYSIADLETYVYTGSRNAADYSHETNPNLYIFPERILSDRYLPLASRLGIDDSQFSVVRATWQHTEGLAVRFRYYLDHVYITFTKTEASSTKQYILSKNHALTENTITAYRADDIPYNGYVCRTIDNVDVIYRIKNGIKLTATLVIDGFVISVYGTDGITDEKRAEAYQDFMTSEKTAPFSALFSDDADTFAAAIAKLKE